VKRKKMNNQGKGVVGLILVVIMIASIFAMFAPISADVGSDDASTGASDVEPMEEVSTGASDVGISDVGISLEKDTVPSGATYTVGDTIVYTMKVSNPTTRTCTLRVYDVYPNGTLVNLSLSLTLLPGGTKTYSGSYVARAEDIDASGFVWNTLGVDGWNNATPPEPIRGEIQKASQVTVPCEFDFTFVPVCCKLMNFTGTSGGSIVNHSWDFGADATPAKLDVSGAPNGKPPITVAYSTCGTKTVTLSGYCALGGFNTTSKSVYVPCNPTAVATASNYSVFNGTGTVVEFRGCDSYADPEAAAKYPGWGIKGYKWTFDDGYATQYTCNVSRVVDGPEGTNICATLEVTDGHCNDTAEVCVYVKTPVHQTLRLYGTFDEGPGDHTVIDPVTGKKPENPPYTDPIAPFYPEAKQAPQKDFVTFNPAIMNHNLGYSDLSFWYCGSKLDVQEENEKVFKRMWYEKEWFKDHDGDGCWDVVVDRAGTYWKTMCIEEWNSIPEWQKITDKLTIREWNDPNNPAGVKGADLYGPAIKQEFAYMFLDDETMPIMIQNGSRVLIPMAHNPANSYRGLNSFDADLDGKTDYVKVESEATLGLDIDHDGVQESMDMDGIELNGNESVVLVLPAKTLSQGKELQFFDHKVKLTEVFGPTPDLTATFVVSDNEGGSSVRETEVDLKTGGVAYFYRAETAAQGQTFYLRVIAINWDPINNVGSARIEVGRMFGQTYANIGANTYWSQKAFIVDEVFYNVVAIKAEDNCIKYIVFREKLPKMPIKLYGKDLKVWAPGEMLPEMPPFNMPHEVIVDVQDTWTQPTSQQDKIGPKEPRIPLEISYTKEGDEMRYQGELKEIYAENENDNYDNEEFWMLEWFHTQPQQYTEFELPPDDKYLVTLSWIANESDITIWDGAGEKQPIVVKKGERVKFWYKVCTGPLYIDKETSSIKVFGTFDKGPGDHTAIDPETGLKPENPPYTDPIAPFYPQASQAPRKDFITFNPAIMEHNQGYSELSFTSCDDGGDVQQEKEKVFKRMWYEKEWFKDHDKDGCWDVVVDRAGTYWKTMCLDEWNSIPEWQKVTDKLTIREWNNDPTINDSNVDIYGPAIKQEFTYMFLDDETMPIMIQSGSRVLIPMAHDPANSYRGLNSFDADLDGVRDYVKVESEKTLGLDIDHDGVQESMDMDTTELNGNESVVLVLPAKTLSQGKELQFFDHKVRLKEVFGPTPTSTATFVVSDNEGGGSVRETEVDLTTGGVAYFCRGEESAPQTFYLRVTAINWNPFSPGQSSARIEVGRMFGQTHANIGANLYWSQKAFIVDQVFYNVVAIKAEDNCIKYITFREKLPKMPIKLYGKDLKVWAPGEMLPEMPPFNMQHEIIVDVQAVPPWTRPYSQQDKIGPKVSRPALQISYTKEDEEMRFKGELKEIYNETLQPYKEFWMLEWFHTKPQQYTAFVLPRGELYLMTLSWFAPESNITIWDGDPTKPIKSYRGERVKFWYDPTDNEDIYMPRIGSSTPPPTIKEYYDIPANGGDADGSIDLNELVNAILGYLHSPTGLFGPDGRFDKGSLINYIMDYLKQEGYL
jgi:hypothetical protein